MGLNNNEPSVLSSRGSYTATDLSRRTDKTSWSVPDDGREVTISTKSRRKNHGDGPSNLATASQTSLLIEYFESGKNSHGNSTSRGPSVRVKLTPSAVKRGVIATKNDSNELVIREADSSRKRRSSINSGATSKGLLEDRKERFTLGEDYLRPNDRARPLSNDLSSLASGDDESRIDNRRAFNLRVSRGRSSPPSSREATEISIRSGKHRSSSKANNKGASLKPKKGRSRSTSREYDDEFLNTKGLGRKRSKSLGRNPTAKERLGKDIGDGSKTSEQRRSRSPSPSRSPSASRSAVTSELSKGKPNSTLTNPALLEAVEDAIKRLILPQLHDLKLNQNKSKFDEATAAFKAKAGITAPTGEDTRTLKSHSMPDVTRPLQVNSNPPMVVLQPDGKGQGFVISGSQNENAADKDGSIELEQLENDNSRALAVELGRKYLSRESLLSASELEKEDGVPLDPTPDEKYQSLAMPPMPLDYPESNYAETRASILTENTGLPYPETAEESGMPQTGYTPPPARSRLSSISSLDNVGGRPVIKEPELHDAPSITTFAEEPEQDRPNTGYSKSSGLRSPEPLNIEPKKTVVKSPSQLSIGSINSISDTPSTKFVKQKEKGKGPASGEGAEINEDKSEVVDSYPRVAKNEMDWFRKRRDLPDPNLQHTTIEVRQLDTNNNSTDGTTENKITNNITNSVYDQMNLEKVGSRQEVYGVGVANPSLVSTPFAIESHQASILDGMSNLSFQTNPLLSANALPNSHDPMPEPRHMHHQDDEETNPSEIQGPISPDAQPWEFGTAGTGLVINGKRQTRGVEIMEHPKDEGYMSTSFGSPAPNQHMPMGNLSNLDDPEYDLYHGGHSRIPSGNSHGMPSPLYDSATGKGLDRIQSKDIVALMDHLTVRDAQRNARDTEILVTLVRSAAEMRNSFEDMKKQLEQAQHEIVAQVDHNTERSVQKVIQGPRPLPPPAPRPRRLLEDDHGETEAARKKSLFKRALKGLSGRSQSDLAKIEQMLERLLGEVEGLKGGQFYQQSILGTIENFRTVPPALPEAPASTSTANSGYYTQTHTAPSGGPSRQTSGFKIYSDEKIQQSHKISPINEILATQPQQPIPIESPPQSKNPPTLPATNTGNTPTRSLEKPKNRESGSSFFPRISRWSESTTTSGVKGFLRKTKDSTASNSDVDFWAETPQQGPAQLQSPFQENHPQDIPRQASPLLPPSSRGTDAPVNYANIRSSLDIKHPQPKVSIVQRHQLEQQAQNFIQTNTSNPSLATFSNPPLSMTLDINGLPLSPMSDTYPLSVNESSLIQGRPPRIDEGEEEDETPTNTPLKEKKSRENRGERKERREKKSKRDLKEKDLEKDHEAVAREKAERRARRRERKEKENGEGKMHTSSKSKLKDEYLPVDGTGVDGRSDLDMSPSTNRTPSTASRLKGPRPLSRSGSDYKTELENSGTVKRHKHRSSHLTSDTFGLGNTIRE